MGIDFSHSEASWAYSGFHIFRTKLAAEAGIALNCMESFAWNYSFGKPYESVRVRAYNENSDFEKSIGIQPVIKWATVNDDIVPLLNHSDCDGILTPEECSKVAPRLRELIKNWSDNDRDKIKALELADGMEKAALQCDNFEFL